MQRFWGKVEKTNDCWNWKAADRGNGYGCFKYQGRLIDSHRISWIIHFGSIPKDKLVCHYCDNRKCVRPEHLFLGSYRDNLIDSIKKGRDMGASLRKDKVEGKAWCTKCKKYLLEIEFTTNQKRWNGLHKQCRQCRKEEYNSEKYREYHRNYMKRLRVLV